MLFVLLICFGLVILTVHDNKLTQKETIQQFESLPKRGIWPLFYEKYLRLYVFNKVIFYSDLFKFIAGIILIKNPVR